MHTLLALRCRSVCVYIKFIELVRPSSKEHSVFYRLGSNLHFEVESHQSWHYNLFCFVVLSVIFIDSSKEFGHIQFLPGNF